MLGKSSTKVCAILVLRISWPSLKVCLDSVSVDSVSDALKVIDQNRINQPSVASGMDVNDKRGAANLIPAVITP
jgi:hypothetical protein